MKISFDIDCTPQEARAFFGLPDLAPLHDLYLDKMKSYVSDGLTPDDFERMAKTWMPGMAESFEKLRGAFWSAAVKPVGGG